MTFLMYGINLSNKFLVYSMCRLGRRSRLDVKENLIDYDIFIQNKKFMINKNDKKLIKTYIILCCSSE